MSAEKPHVHEADGGSFPSLVGGNAADFEVPAAVRRVSVHQNGWGSSSETSVSWWEVHCDGEMVARRDSSFFATRLAKKIAKKHGLERRGSARAWGAAPDGEVVPA